MLVLVIAILTWVSPAGAGSLRIAVVSDLNGSYGSTRYGSNVFGAVDRILEIDPDLVIVTGDMVAGQQRNPHLTDGQVAAMWEAFHGVVTDPLAAAGIPMLVTPGNHDASNYGGFERERRAFSETWTAHSPDVEILDGERYPFRYAVSHGGVLFISLDVTTVGSLPAEEMDWLRQILREESARHRATVLFSHLPLWPFARNRETEIIGDPALVSLIEDAGVDLYLSGHHHAYYPGVSNGVIYLSQACLGSGSRALIGASGRSRKAFTVVAIDPAGTIDEYALQAPAFEDRIALETLPPSIGHGPSKLTRRDLATE